MCVRHAGNLEPVNTEQMNIHSVYYTLNPQTSNVSQGMAKDI